MKRSFAQLGGLGLCLCLVLSARAGPGPESWPVRLSEVFHVEPGEIEQITFSWDDGLRSRRFFLILDAPAPFEAKLNRGLDGTRLFSGLRESRYAAVIPWGTDEVAHLALKAEGERDVHVTVKLATDPAEAGLAVYGFQLNRFLDLTAKGRRELAHEALEQAMQEDPGDSLTTLLWNRMWAEEGLTQPPTRVDSDEQERALRLSVTEGQRLSFLRDRVNAALTRADPDSAWALLEAADDFEMRTSWFQLLRLRGRVALEQRAYPAALGALDDALDLAADADERFQIYDLMVQANLAVGNEGQARAIVDRAILEAPSNDAKERAAAWIEVR